MRYSQLDFFNSTVKSTQGSGSGIWIFLGIFFGIIIVLVIIATIGSRKDKNEKMIAENKKNKIKLKSSSLRIVIFSSLNKLINDLNKELKDFKPSIGLKNLGQINKEYLDIVKAISNSRELRDVYLFSDYKIELKEIIDELKNNKPSNWKKEATFSLNLVNVKFNAIKTNKNNESLIKEGENKQWIKK